MALPTEAEIEELHRQYATNDQILALVWTHCLIVRDVADQLMTTITDIDKELVRVGALLHDIGVYSIFQTNGTTEFRDNYIQHGVLGEELLRREGFSETICRFASHHTGVGITRLDIEKLKLPLPNQDYLAETKEERLVMYADKFHSKVTPPVFNSLERARAKLTKFGPDKVTLLNNLVEEFGEPNLEPLAQKYHQPVRTQ